MDINGYKKIVSGTEWGLKVTPPSTLTEVGLGVNYSICSLPRGNNDITYPGNVSSAQYAERMVTVLVDTTPQ